MEENPKQKRSVRKKLGNPTEEKGCFLLPCILTIHREPSGTFRRFLVLEDNGVSKINHESLNPIDTGYNRSSAG